MNILSTALSVLATTIAIVSAVHALLLKRDPKAAIGWIAVCLLIPFGGPLLYYFFGINRVRTRALKLQRRSESTRTEDAAAVRVDEGLPLDVADSLIENHELVNISDAVTDRPLVGGNLIDVLHNGEDAYPAMLEAIEQASQSLFLATYIFEADHTGRLFIDALERAVCRGVDVRVIIDGLSDVVHLPRAGRILKKRHISVATFLPPQLIPPSVTINLRNHRKILVADGKVGFTGGINISDSHLAHQHENSHRVVDIHFRLTGPVVKQIEQVFIEDWGFLTGVYEGTARGEAQAVGSAACRVITEGPNEDLDKLVMILIGAVSAAKTSVVIMTPYFLPPRGLLSALQATALRGIEVTIILPAQNDSLLAHWATRNLLWELLERGVRVYYQPPPFVHSKLVIIDDHYLHIGSANIDPRSLRLNFELAVEVFDRPLAQALTAHVKSVIRRSLPVTIEELDSRLLPERIRDSLAWLMSPYL
ncbi:MAG: PLDc N-terminal domain-containing protein [Deltaproteobacteria bacterium]|nr:PLDc N-terminal domain-containing protein [Deltaproteobacteria bacterium]MBN2687860.1 PLDc N-terminal domain-containing protein [Deltaproteobacteria bacterium]